MENAFYKKLSNLSHTPFHTGLPGIIFQSQYFMFMKSSIGYRSPWGFIHIRFLVAVPSQNAKALEFTRERNNENKATDVVTKEGVMGRQKLQLLGEAQMVERQQAR